ncbi:MAG: SusC/RagA family TonB-linked outer membrane protein [Bacteroidales bacterium]|nr:SusC/RagA family TonB-linked outer membrane protein [Bacteroidales bacterium]
MFLSFMLLLNAAALGQNRITGTVTDQTGEPLFGVTVVVEGTLNGTSTGINGKYEIVANASDKLHFSFIGMEEQRIDVGSQTVINVKLSDSAEEIDAVVVVGYKTVSRRNLSASITSVQTDDIQGTASASLTTMLAGKAVGLQSVVRSGTPGGGGGGLVIRGNTSLSDANDVTGLSNPLYIIDGVPMALEDFAGFDVTQNDFLATLNPSEIESIDILKDAAATAIYGSRGANGVIIINTKRGNKGKTRFNFSSATGINFKPTPLRVYVGQAERDEKLRLYEESFKALFGEREWIDLRNGLEVKGYMLPSVLTDKYNPAFNNAYDYQDMFYQNGVTQQYDLSMDGGSDKSAFRVGMGYFDEKGVLIGYDFSRMNLNASLTNDINKSIHNDFSVRLTYMQRNGGQEDFMKAYPTDPTNLPSSLYYKTPEELDLLQGKLGDVYNKNKTYLASLNESLRITITEGLTLDNQVAVSANLGARDYFVPSTASESNLSQAESSNNTSITTNAHSVLSYTRQIGESNIVALAGTEINMDNLAKTVLTAENGPSDYVKVINGYNKENVNGYSDFVKTNMFSYFANLAYGYKDRYKVEGVIRRDASSRFGENNKWATFPSVKAYWMFTREPWMQGLTNILSFGKIRVSFGSSGSIAGDPLLQYNSFIATSNLGAGINNIYANKLDIKTYGGNGVLVSDFNKIANKSLSWSKSKEIDYGIDLEFLDNRIYVTADVYSRYLEGLVFTSYLPPYAGFTSIRSNLVDMISNGWELSTTAYLFPRQSEFQWEWTVNLAQNNSFIAKLGNNGRDYITDNYAFVLGSPAFQYYTYEYLGVCQYVDELPVNPMTGEAVKYLWADAGLALNQQGTIFPGMPLFTDANGDYMIDGADYGYDKKIIDGKSPEPKIMGGLHTTIKYKGLSLRVQSSFAFGHYIFNTSLQSMLSTYDDNTTFFTQALYDMSTEINFWEQPGDDAYYPMRYITYSDGGSSRSFRSSSMFIEKGDYWSIDNITLSYNLPKKLVERANFRGLNVYATLKNPYMWKASLVPDPRMVSKTGYYNGQGYPISRSMVFGINVQF